MEPESHFITWALTLSSKPWWAAWWHVCTGKWEGKIKGRGGGGGGRLRRGQCLTPMKHFILSAQVISGAAHCFWTTCLVYSHISSAYLIPSNTGPQELFLFSIASTHISHRLCLLPYLAHIASTSTWMRLKNRCLFWGKVCNRCHPPTFFIPAVNLMM